MSLADGTAWENEFNNDFEVSNERDIKNKLHLLLIKYRVAYMGYLDTSKDKFYYEEMNRIESEILKLAKIN